ncbi:MAG: PHP domain-containing protein [Cetobacterium sp.]
MYNNYHSHKIYSNLKSLDVVTKPIQYLERMKELGHTNYFTTEHGYQGNIYEAKTLCDEYGFKVIVGTEFYYVNDATEKDRSNYHLICIAMNDNGYKQINKALSYANTTGLYYKPRIDKKVLMSFNPNDVIITTACTAGILSIDNHKELMVELKEHFGKNLFLEVQSHNHISQKEHNEKVLKLSKELDIDIIHANDSHYIKPEDAKYRTLFLKAKGIEYPEEEGYILDYPTRDDILDRYRKQGVLTEEDSIRAINNTLVFNNCEEITIINDNIKLPSVSDNPNKELKDIINNEWIKHRDEVPRDRWEEYIKEIKYEMDIIEKTNMEDYFILDYKIVKRAIDKYNGMLTKTGRGSAVSFYINKLLGLTEIDRIDSPVTLYPTRFMSIERILGTKSLPDIDLNSENPEPFIQATKDLLGEENCAWMISYKPLQDASAFRLWCKANDMKVSEYDEVAKNLDKYRNNSKWKDIIEESKNFVGVVESISPSPCSMILYDKPIDEEIGLIRTKEGICCNIDGYNCDKYKYLKNDYLSVKVYKIIRQVCEMANIKIPTIKELTELLNDKTFDIYKNKLTCTINQADSDFATALVSDYGINSVAEASAFVAAIRPGFASLLDNFIERKPYTTGVDELDNILKDSYHYLMYQESIMKYLIWLGIKESESYDIIKKIAKKKFKEKELIELKTKLKEGWIKQVGKEEGFDDTWQVVEDASKYSFNASHSLSYAYDSLYGAYLKANYPLEYYAVTLNLYNDDIDRTIKLTDELNYFDIKLQDPKFRYSKAEYFPNKETNTIYKGIESIKYLNAHVGEYLYSLRDNTYNTFTDLLIDIKGHINSKQLEILIKLDFFGEFGKTYKLMKTKENFENYYDKKQFKKDSLDIQMTTIIQALAQTETAKLYKDINTLELCKLLESQTEDKHISLKDRIHNQIEHTGSCNITDSNVPGNACIVISIDTTYSPRITLYNLRSGNTKTFKMKTKTFNDNQFELFDIIQIYSITQEPKKKRIENGVDKNGKQKYKYIDTDIMEDYLSKYEVTYI